MFKKISLRAQGVKRSGKAEKLTRAQRAEIGKIVDTLGQIHVHVPRDCDDTNALLFPVIHMDESAKHVLMRDIFRAAPHLPRHFAVQQAFVRIFVQAEPAQRLRFTSILEQGFVRNKMPQDAVRMLRYIEKCSTEELVRFLSAGNLARPMDQLVRVSRPTSQASTVAPNLWLPVQSAGRSGAPAHHLAHAYLQENTVSMGPDKVRATLRRMQAAAYTAFPGTRQSTFNVTPSALTGWNPMHVSEDLRALLDTSPRAPKSPPRTMLRDLLQWNVSQKSGRDMQTEPRFRFQPGRMNQRKDYTLHTLTAMAWQYAESHQRPDTPTANKNRATFQREILSTLASDTPLLSLAQLIQAHVSSVS